MRERGFTVFTQRERERERERDVRKKRKVVRREGKGKLTKPCAFSN